MDATLIVRVPAAAQAEGKELDFEVQVDGDGQPWLLIMARNTANRRTADPVVLAFHPKDHERLKAAMAKVDETIEQLRAKGIVFETP